ncbi:MAG: SPOR domain-containing protein [Thiohalomonadales bacterium]
MNERDFKKRMIGAIVLIALGVIFIPILLNGDADDGMPSFGSNIPERHKSIIKMKPLNLSSNISPPETKKIETIIVDKLSPKITNQSKVNKNLSGEISDTDSSQENRPVKPVENENTQADIKTLKATTWVIQVGSFSNKKNALALQEKLRKKKYHAFVEAVSKKSEVSYRVRIGPELIKNSAETTKERLKKEMHINGIVMRYKG